MQKHVVNEHNLDLHKYLFHTNFNVKGRDGGIKKKCKQKVFATPTTIMNFFGNVRPYKRSNLNQMGFIKDLVLMIAKGYMPLVEVNGVAPLWSSSISFS
jgi:hypothetical protein